MRMDTFIVWLLDYILTQCQPKILIYHWLPAHDATVGEGHIYMEF